VTLTALTVAATVVTAGSQIYSGMAQNSQAKYEAAVAMENRKHEEAAIQDTWQRRNIDQLRHWRRVSQQLGEARAGAAASGLDVNFGSVADTQQDISMIGMEDSSTINQNAIKEAQGYDINAANYTMQARAAKARGKAALVGSIIGATGTLLSGASQVGKGLASPGGGSSGTSSSFGPITSNYHYTGAWG
jgi:hypothetical protein